jgi:hypothetical protein
MSRPETGGDEPTISRYDVEVLASGYRSLEAENAGLCEEVARLTEALTRILETCSNAASAEARTAASVAHDALWPPEHGFCCGP